MKLFKSRLERVLSKITEENLLLLDDSERTSVYCLEKLLAWQTDYDWIDWNDFKDWVFCNRCGSYTRDRCICYAR